MCGKKEMEEAARVIFVRREHSDRRYTGGGSWSDLVVVVSSLSRV